MRAIYSLVAVLALVVVAWVGAGAGLQYLFGVVIPYAAFLVFLLGFLYKVVGWARSPVPLPLATTAGQQYSLPWIKQAKLDNPSTTAGTVGRMILEIFLFRTLFRNTKMELVGDKVVYGSTKWLWFFGLVFHWTFFIILFRHLRLFLEPVPFLVGGVETLDSLFQITVPALYMTDGLILAGLTFLFVRRLVVPQLKYTSLPADFFPLLLIGAIVLSGIFMRYVTKIDVEAVKRLTMGLVTLHPTIPAGVSSLFFIHVFLVSVLLAYFPFSKLMHAGGIFLSPTRNMPNNSRMVHHVNPWNPPLDSLGFMTYEMWEDEFREKMREADMPLEKE